MSDDGRHDDAARLVYEHGADYVPNDRFGLIRLTLSDDGRVALSNRTGQVAWAARLTDPHVLQEIVADLRSGGFPALPDLPLPLPGTTIRKLVVTTDAGTETLVIAWQGHEKSVGFTAAFARLDEIISQVSARMLNLSQSPQGPLVSDVTPLAGWTDS